VPCDDDVPDVFSDWSGTGYSDGASFLIGHDPVNEVLAFSVASTCIGCGVREATDNLTGINSRSDSVWVMIVLTDGNNNFSEIPSIRELPWEILHDVSKFPLGFCQGSLEPPTEDVNYNYWFSRCVDREPLVRHCIDASIETCPPGTVDNYQTNFQEKAYSTLDYALDMVDYAALTYSANSSEPLGNDIAIYSIGVGEKPDIQYDLLDFKSGEYLLRYMANIGDDGARGGDCTDLTPDGVNCGQYYRVANGGGLTGVFNNIASRIYTKINR
jgi:hypothetical protein